MRMFFYRIILRRKKLQNLLDFFIRNLDELGNFKKKREKKLPTPMSPLQMCAKLEKVCALSLVCNYLKESFLGN